MILHTIINGATIAGAQEKPIVHPSTGESPDAISYAHTIDIPVFSRTLDTKAWQSEVVRAAKAMSGYIEKNKDRIARLAADETGSPVSYQYSDIEGSRLFLEKIRTLAKLASAQYTLTPKGNVLLILCANEPIITSTILTFSALFMGNTVFVKPSSKTPSFAHTLISELTKMPHMKNRVHFLLVDAEETERLIKEKAFDFVLSFGSRSTNNKLAVTCAQAEVEFLPESEGNDWAYVDKDCTSIKKMSTTILESFLKHNGQMCNALRGVMIHSSIYESLAAQLKKDFIATVVGSPRLTATQIGALINGTESRAHALATQASAHAQETWSIPVRDGAFAPMIIVEPEDSSQIFSESIFAPVLWIKKVKDHREALASFQAKNRHGLGFSLFSKNKKVISEFLAQIRVGRININKPPMHIGLFDPLGGLGLSGRGGPGHWIEKVSNRTYLNK